MTVKTANPNLDGTHAGTLYQANNFINQLDAKKPEKANLRSFTNADPIDIDADIDQHPYRCKF